MCAHAVPWRCPGSLATGIPCPLEEQHGKNAGRKGQLRPKSSDWEEKPTTSPHVILAPSLREAPPADPPGAPSARSPALFDDLCTTEPAPCFVYLPVQTHIRANPAHQGYLLLSKPLCCVKLIYSMNSQDIGTQLEPVLPALSETRTEGSCLALHGSHLGHIGRGQVHRQLQSRPGSPSGNSPLLPPYSPRLPQPPDLSVCCGGSKHEPCGVPPFPSTSASPPATPRLPRHQPRHPHRPLDRKLREGVRN